MNGAGWDEGALRGRTEEVSLLLRDGLRRQRDEVQPVWWEAAGTTAHRGWRRRQRHGRTAGTDGCTEDRYKCGAKGNTDVAKEWLAKDPGLKAHFAFFLVAFWQGVLWLGVDVDGARSVRGPSVCRFVRDWGLPGADEGG